jgi:hypothetical protein
LICAQKGISDEPELNGFKHSSLTCNKPNLVEGRRKFCGLYQSHLLHLLMGLGFKSERGPLVMMISHGVAHTDTACPKPIRSFNSKRKNQGKSTRRPVLSEKANKIS